VRSISSSSCVDEVVDEVVDDDFCRAIDRLDDRVNILDSQACQRIITHFIIFGQRLLPILWWWMITIRFGRRN